MNNHSEPPANGEFAGNPGDEMKLSNSDQEIERFLSIIAEMPDIRQAMVNDIRQRVLTGTYTVDARKIAQRLLSQICKSK